jgi:hypothetical protein
VAAHAFSLISESVLANVPADQQAAFASQRAPAIAMFEAQCRQQAWSETQRRCAVAATSPFQLGACTTTSVTPHVTPAPPGTDASCTAVGKHVAAITSQPVPEDLVPGVPEDVREMLATHAPDLASQVETACVNGNWSEPLRRCLLGIQRPLDVPGCQMAD